MWGPGAQGSGRGGGRPAPCSLGGSATAARGSEARRAVLFSAPDCASGCRGTILRSPLLEAAAKEAQSRPSLAAHPPLEICAPIS